MLWELMAMIFSGFLLAGIVLSLRLFVRAIPKWMVPVAAGIGMFGFQIYSEYTWFSETSAKLPKGSVVVAKVPQTVFYKPWSYVVPQVLQFVVLDKNGIVATDTPEVYEGTLYFFERRMSAHALRTLFDCSTRQYAHILSVSQPLQWQSTAYTEAALMEICE